MVNTTVARERRFPLHVHISVLFTLLLLLTGVVLGLFNYQQTSQLIFSSSSTLFERIQHDVQRDLDSTYRPIRHLLSLLALNPATQATTLDERLKMLPLLAQALRDNPKLASIYLGYEDGDFFMVRPLHSEQLKQHFNAPANATYQVWTIDRSSAGTESDYLFYDGSLNQLTRRQNLNEPFDPRRRNWFRRARDDGGQITTAPYPFFSTQEIGTTLARRSGLTTVIAADLTLDDLSATLANHRVTPNSQVVLADNDGNAVAYPDSSRLLREVDGEISLVQVSELNPALGELLSGQLNKQDEGIIELARQRWAMAHRHIQEGGPQGLHLALLVPEQELLAEAYRIRWQGALITLTTLLLCLPLGWLTSRLVVKPLCALVEEAQAIRRFDFSHPASGRSPILEVDQLAVSMSSMKDTLSSFLDIAASLSAETHFDALIKRVMDATVSISKAQGGLLYLRDNDSGRLEPQSLVIDGQGRNLAELGIHALNQDDPTLPDWLQRPASGESVATSIGFDQAGSFQRLLSAMDSPRLHLIATGLHNRQGDTVGVLVLLQRDTGEDCESMLSPDRIAFVEAVSGSAALCIESQRLLARQKQLLDAFIQLIAGAIDAKSPYTGGHCQRVPEITLMLAHAAAESDAPEFRDYNPSEEEWEALHIAAWLHDCGKVTTPEYVVDKATKLETLYDRIHEVRMRFEVLKRDAWIAYWRGRAEGGEESALAALRDRLVSELDDEFAFIARINLGGEAMADADQQRLRQIAERRWLRTLDNRLGVSWEEAKRLERSAPASLPVEEPLLADRLDHLIERPEQELIAPDNRWGFKLEVPTYKFNRGELHNLSIARGTLTAEERYIINHHIVQTILMLDRLPFPKHLQNVTEIAGGHHEKMDGSGYPKRLTREQMSLPARMMAIADIFEALTAVDRPYKKGKTLSEALNIMVAMCKGAHIDPQLFALFLRSGIHRHYAERFMQPEQIDEVDEQLLLEKVEST
ncbi:MAG: HD domain-containing phosphohydrolase [Pseudomonas sp.]|jgi:HD-GYP domain-containing protein (c-di-GMP phosphodiesterase class II)|uniref:HD domain-containing phosphohydrolase n=1 Tax=Ectopseudomonas mendocina TaxID=300 RepID=UPI003132F9F1